MNKEVARLILNLGVNLKDIKEYHKVNTHNRYNGLYVLKEDQIYINWNKFSLDEDSLNRVILHELGHWTGYMTRLERYTLDISIWDDNFVQLQHLEEAIADKTMYKLVEYLDLPNKEFYLGKMTEYVANFPFHDSIKSEVEADKALDFIVKLVEERNVA